ncbi:uncharacterized protein LOC119128979 isoform X2 [Syngnathus acus]|uniref:uncharacterized protein LOC119128979 isoform X2 n=1 Tax=Syngnathus acus TaxID=161584 RepID=UPI001885CC7D|nr:uncharacterized protein LOC119128979 isoform X2 [Syngnathus acus]
MQKLLDTLSHIPSEASECVVKDMKATAGLVVWLFTLSQGMDTPCDGRRERALCYGPLGGEIVFSLVDKDTSRFNWKKETVTVVKVRPNQTTFPKRFSFTPNNGRMKIENLMRNDSGNYTLCIFGEKGEELQFRTLQLFIEDPVISVHLVSKCQFQGKQPVTCLPKGGDNLQYSWSLNKKPLQDSDLLSGDVQANNITLKPSISGQLVCSVKNNVSEIRKEVVVPCGMDTPCDGRREGTLCYGPLGGEIVFSLVDKDTFGFNWYKETVTLVNVRQNQIKFTFSKRFSFTPNNGRLKIEDLMRNDSGNYTLSIFDKSGAELGSRTLQLFIEDPVISVHLVSKCQFQGKQPVTCLPKGGDNLQYSWSLNKKPLQDSDLLPGDVQANNIILKPSISGQLVCSVKNNVSEIRKEVFVSCVFINCTSNGTLISEWLPEINKTLCDTFIDGSKSNQRNNYLLIMGGVLSALFILLMIGLAVVYKQKKKQSSIEDEEELTYANVRINHQPRRANTEIEDGMVEYGQVRFSERPRRTVVVNNDPSTYGQVRRDR